MDIRRVGRRWMVSGSADVSVSLFEKYGGFAQVSKIVMAIYESPLDSDRLADYF